MYVYRYVQRCFYMYVYKQNQWHTYRYTWRAKETVLVLSPVSL